MINCSGKTVRDFAFKMVHGFLVDEIFYLFAQVILTLTRFLKSMTASWHFVVVVIIIAVIIFAIVSIWIFFYD